MEEARRILEEADSVLVVGCPSADVPDALARAGFDVIVKTGETEYAARELAGDEMVDHPVEIPSKFDVVYLHGSAEHLPGVLMVARSLGAKAIWFQSGRTEGGATDPKGCWLPEDEALHARESVEAAGLAYVDDTYIVDAVREAAIKK